MSERDDVLATNAAFYRAFANADTAAMEAIWADDADAPTVVHPGSGAITGRRDVLESWSSIFEGAGRVNVRFSDPDAHLHGDIAIVLCNEVVHGHGLTATNVFRRTGDGWRLLHHHAGPRQAPARVAMETSRSLH